jgi:hypothetical protein
MLSETKEYQLLPKYTNEKAVYDEEFVLSDASSSSTDDEVPEQRIPHRALLKGAKEHVEEHFDRPELVRDCILGLSDGLTVPFALAAGLSSLGDSRIVIYGGVAGRLGI